jgi:hypothetical protein
MNNLFDNVIDDKVIESLTNEQLDKVLDILKGIK